MQRPILLMQAGDAPPFIVERAGNFDKMFYRAAGLDQLVSVTVHISRGEEPEPPESYSGVIITGSHDMVTDHKPWSEKAAAWLRRAVAAGIPIFGVCYGHQLLAYALGGEVGYLDGGEELGTLPVRLTDAGRRDPLLASVPDSFETNLAHSQTVLTLPDGARILAASNRDPHQMLGYGPGVYTVQFHPEFNRQAALTYFDYYTVEKPNKAEQYGRDRATAADTPIAEALLRRFVDEWCMR